jgi:hypothetical protein
MKVFLRACLIAFTGLVIYSMATHWLAWRFAMGDWPVPAGTPWTYQLWSGIIPGLTVLTLFGAVLSMYHLHNCHSARCWRIGKHRINGTPWCTRHEAEGRAYHSEECTLGDILAALNRLIELLESK